MNANRPHWTAAHVPCDSAAAAAANVQADGLDSDRSEAVAVLEDFREWLRDGHPLTLSADDWGKLDALLVRIDVAGRGTDQPGHDSSGGSLSKSSNPKSR